MSIATDQLVRQLLERVQKLEEELAALKAVAPPVYSEPPRKRINGAR